MKFLLSNDDGYTARGLAVLAQTLADYGEVRIVAPEQDRSGASNSLTLDRPLSIRKATNGFYHVNGTPTDCIHLAVNVMNDYRPDMVFSGINHGANLGDDTLYSGTVAAATEAYLLDIPAIAVSLAGRGEERHFETVAHVVKQFMTLFKDGVLGKEPFLWNINVPNIPLSELKGIKATRLGVRHHIHNLIEQKNPKGESVYWIGPSGDAKDNDQGTDFWAIDEAYASVTALSIDLTDDAALPYMSQAVQGLNKK